MMMRRLLPFLAASLAACAPNGDQALVGTLERDRIELAAESSEPVIALHAREGARVAAGDAILELDPARAEAERDRLAAERAGAQRRLDELLRGPRAERIREARARQDAAAGQLQSAEREFRRIGELQAENLASAAQLDTARARLDAARGERDAAAAALDALLEGTTIEELDQARAQLEAATAALRAQELILRRLSVRAPRDAYVEALPWKTGSQPPRGAAVAVLLADGAPFARIHVPAGLRDRYAVDAPVIVRVTGFGDFPGRVRWISSAAAFTPYFALTEHDRDRLSYAAEVELTGDGAHALPAGVPVEVVRADAMR